MNRITGNKLFAVVNLKRARITIWYVSQGVQSSDKECESKIGECILNINRSLYSVSRLRSDIHLPYCALRWLFHLLETTTAYLNKVWLVYSRNTKCVMILWNQKKVEMKATLRNIPWEKNNMFIKYHIL